jgi:aminopeptidase 2
MLQTTVYRIVLMNGGLAEYEAVLKEYLSTEDNQVRKYPMYTLGATRDRALKMRTLDWAVKSGQVKMQDTFYPFGSVTGTVEGQDMAWRYFQEVSLNLVYLHIVPTLRLITFLAAVMCRRTSS